MKSKSFKKAIALWIMLIMLCVSILDCNTKKQKDNTNLFLGLFLLCRSSSTNSLGSENRSTVLSTYNNDYLQSTVVSLGWTGSVSGCIAGTTSDDSQTKTLNRINFFRNRVELGNVSWDTTTFSKTQEAALMMKANNTLNHNPPSTWTCYTSDGANAAGSSNLAGSHSADAITAYMQDAGSNNTAAGHRRWILYSRAQTMGSGNTDTSNALWVIGNFASSYPSSMPTFISWPPKGFIPRQLVFDRWSFSVPAADFTNATVTMTAADNSNISLSKEPIAVGYGDNTIVWIPTGINTSSKSDILYTIKISNVIVSGVTKSYEYTVNIIDPGDSGVATEIPNVTWTTTGFFGFYQAIGQRFILNCPSGGTANNLWGVDQYIYLSSVCTAAVHAGKITLATGGKVTIIIRDGVSTFTGSTRNGVTSYSQSGWTSKHFVFE